MQSSRSKSRKEVCIKRAFAPVFCLLRALVVSTPQQSLCTLFLTWFVRRVREGNQHHVVLAGCWEQHRATCRWCTLASISCWNCFFVYVWSWLMTFRAIPDEVVLLGSVCHFHLCSSLILSGSSCPLHSSQLWGCVDFGFPENFVDSRFFF